MDIKVKSRRKKKGHKPNLANARKRAIYKAENRRAKNKARKARKEAKKAVKLAEKRARQVERNN